MKTCPSIRVLFVQPEIPHYRLDFFTRLSHRPGLSITVAYSEAKQTNNTSQLKSTFPTLPLYPIFSFFGLCWQPGLLSLDLTKYDVLVVAGNPRFISSLFLLAFARYLGIKTVSWAHYWSSTSNRFRQIIRLSLLSFVDAYLFYTDDELHSFHRENIFLREPSITSALNNGINFEPILRLRKPYHSLDRGHKLLFIGRVTPKASLCLAIEALGLLNRNDIELHIIGDGPLVPSLQSLAASLSLKDQIFWYGPLRSEKLIASIANKCTIFIYPGDVGLSLIHGFSYGLPAIIHNTRRRHMPEVSAFLPNMNGWTFSRGDSLSLASTISSAFNDHSLLDLSSSYALSSVGDKYTTAGMAESFCSLIHKLYTP